MRIFLKVIGFGSGVVVLAAASTIIWFFFYSRDLPATTTLAHFSPHAPTTVSSPCLTNATVAIPYDAIGPILRSALSVAESGEDGPSAIEQTYRGFSDVRDGRSALSFQVARTMFCAPEKPVTRELQEL
jgi:membrane carboxypeptidase/penicillin-binding protein